MDNTIVYLDEAAYALATLAPMLPFGEARAPTRWILIGCAPRATNHVSKWVTHSVRQSWRSKWAAKVFSQVVPVLQGPGDLVMTQIASGPLCDLTDALMAQYGPGRVWDARRPKPGHALQPVTRTQSQDARGLWSYAAAMAATGMWLAAD